MNAVCLKHVEFEGAGKIRDYFLDKKWAFSEVSLFKDEHLHFDFSNIDSVVVMGGPMSVSDDQVYPFLKWEKAFLGEMISRGCKVIGVCLGAQLLAQVLNADVYRGQKEIGWFDLEVTNEVLLNELG